MNFDWTTFALQLVNVLILLAILRHFLFRPVVAIIEKRRSETDAARLAAQQAKTEADAASANARAEAEASAAARHRVLSDAQKEADAKRAALLEKTHADAAKILADGRAALDREEALAQSRLMASARDLAMTIATRALSAQPDTMAGYIERLGDALASMPPIERDALLGGGNLQLVGHTPLADRERESAQKLLEQYGADAAFATDPALIRGLELQSGSGALRNSLAHDLDAIGKAMQDDRATS